MNFTIPNEDCLRIISDQLSTGNVIITLQSNEYINQASIVLTRRQCEDLMKKIMLKLPNSEELANTLLLLSKGKRV